MTSPGSEFTSTLNRAMLGAVLTGSRRLAIWGFSETTLYLLNSLNSQSLSPAVVLLVDSRANFQGLVCHGHTIAPPEALLRAEVDCIVIAEDAGKESILRSLSTLLHTRPRLIFAGSAHLNTRDPALVSIETSLLVPSRAAGYPLMRTHLFETLKAIAMQGLEGDIAELGVYKGGTTVFLAKTMRHLGIKGRILAFDTFEGFPGPRSVLDLYDDPHDSFNDYESVRTYCEQFGVELVKGDILDTLGRLDGARLILSFFDTDNYSATKHALGRCYEQTVRGGALAFDHYHCDERWVYTIGERMAASEVLFGKPVFHLHGTGIFLKLA